MPFCLECDLKAHESDLEPPCPVDPSVARATLHDQILNAGRVQQPQAEPLEGGRIELSQYFHQIGFPGILCTIAVRLGACRR